MKERIKVFLLDDHQIVRDGIKSLLNENPDIEIIGEAEDCYQFFKSIKLFEPQVVLMDISLPKMSGIEVTKRIKNDHPDLKIIMLSMYTDEDFIFNSLKAGASGYLPKNTTKSELVNAIKHVVQGKEYFSPEISEILLKSFVKKAQTGYDKEDNEPCLTSREREILRLVAMGKHNQEIADELFISTRTVESHRNNMMKKLDINSTVDLVKYAIRKKVIEL